MGEELQFRLIFIGLFVSLLSLSTYCRRLARRSGGVIPRRQEGTLALVLRGVMAVPMLLTILVYAFLPRWMDWSAVLLPSWVRFLAAGVGLSCLLLVRWVFRSIGANISETVLTKRGHELVTGGPYRWVRHPLYAVGLLMILSLSVIAANWFMVLLWLIGVLVFRFVVIPIEEGKLIEAFGEAYEHYRQRTGALLPRL
jgi:protein-S-isoprenylcysteine O-methyltransferase Ste14